MLNKFQKIGFAFLLVLCFGSLLAWKFFVVPDRPEDTLELKRRLAITAANVSSSSVLDDSEQSLRIFGVNVVRLSPFKNATIGYGIYMGQGRVLTAASILGQEPNYARPHVIIADQDLPAAIVRKDSLEETGLAVLSVSEDPLPFSLRLRRNSICRELPQPGTNVIAVYPERITHSKVVSPFLIPPQYQARFRTLTDEPQAFGSGVFNAEKKCLIGIFTGRITKYETRRVNGRTLVRENGFAGYFVPVLSGQMLPPSPSQ